MRFAFLQNRLHNNQVFMFASSALLAFCCYLHLANLTSKIQSKDSTVVFFIFFLSLKADKKRQVKVKRESERERTKDGKRAGRFFFEAKKNNDKDDDHHHY